MIWIKPDKSYSLQNEYGAIFWRFGNKLLYGIDALGEGNHRAIRELSEQSEEKIGLLYFGSWVPEETLTLSAEHWAGQIGVLLEYHATVNFRMDMYSTITWYNWGETNPTGDYNRLYRGTASFTLRHEPGEPPETRGIYHPEEATGGIARWNGVWSSDDDTPESKGQILSWRGKYGSIRGMTMDDGPGGSEDDPQNYLVIAGSDGSIRWMDISEWTDTKRAFALYKQFGIIGAKEIRDIAIDRHENILWILDGGKKLHKIELEPFGSESSGYINTPKGLKLTPELWEIDPGEAISIEAQVLDMWGEAIRQEGIEVQFISSGLGEFLIDEDEEDYSITMTTNTNDQGIAEVVYRGSESDS